MIKTLLDTPFEELEKWDDRSLREWILQYTYDQGVVDLFEFISVLECMTENWCDHSASDNLFVRKMHYAEKRMRRLLVLARAGLGRALPGPRRRRDRERRRAAARRRASSRS